MKRILRIVLFVIIGIIFIGTFYLLWANSRPKEVVYEIATVQVGDIEDTSVATGKISPRDEVAIKPQISGIVAELFKEAGEFVSVGEVIARVKVIPDVSTLSAAESRLKLSEIALKQVGAEYVRIKQLFEKGVIARDEMEKMEADYGKAQEEREESRANLDIIKTGISQKTAMYSNTQIRSTIKGKVLDVPIKVGNSVIQSNNFNDGTTIAIVADMADMIFIGKLDETEVGRVHDGMPMKLSVGAIENQKFDARLEYISPKGLEENGAILFEIKAAAQIPDSVTIRAGYSANAEIVLASVKQALCVPESAIELIGGESFVYVLKSNTAKEQIFERRRVEIGMSDGIVVEIKSGLSEGERVRGNEISDK